MKPLDLADKYESLSEDEYAPDSEPTVKVQVPNFLPSVIVDEDADVHDRDTIPDMQPYQDNNRYPGVGLALVLVTGCAFWGAVAWLLFVR